MSQTHNEDLARTLDALYWIRHLERDLTQTAEHLVAHDPLPLTVDQRLANMKKNREVVMEGLASNFPLMSDGEKFAKAAESAAHGRPPVQVVQALAKVVRRPATEVDWIDALGTQAYLSGEPLLPPSPFEARQRAQPADLER